MLEIRNIIQEIQVSASQEIQAQQARISSLQTEIQQSQQQKKDLLLAQREELTQHYDMLLQQREEMHSTRDHDIVQKIQLLDNRFETLTLENTKVKALYREKKLQYEQLHEQIIQKDEKIKKLTYDLEDTQSNFMTKEDQYNRRISQLENDREHWLEEKSLFMKDYEMKLEQVGLLTIVLSFLFLLSSTIESTRKSTRTRCTKYYRTTISSIPRAILYSICLLATTIQHNTATTHPVTSFLRRDRR